MINFSRIGEEAYSIAKSLAKRTNFGKKLYSIKQSAIEAKNIPLDKQTQNIGDVFESVAKGINGREKAIMQNLAADKSFNSALKVYSKKTNLNYSNLISMNQTELFKTMAESGGVGPNKFLQIISSDKELLAQLPEGCQKIALDSRSSNTATRTIQEAQVELSAAFSGGYQAKKLLGVGTIGEAYLVKDASGKEFVAKMVKKGVDKELLDSEEEVFTKLLGNIISDPQKAEQKVKMLKGLYKDWKKELDFSLETDYNHKLAKGAKRFSVANITEISKDTKSVIYEKANGIQANTFIEMIKDFKENPKAYFEKYKALIDEYPAMRTPTKALAEFAQNFMGSFNEMLLFSKKGVKGSVMHGDPHAGNVFVSFTAKGKAKTKFIDTGNCVVRSRNEIKGDLNFFTNYFVGNSKEIAKYFVERAELLPKNKTKEEITKELSSKIHEKLFNSGRNVTNFDDNQKIIDNILDQHGILLSTESSTALKAELQAINTIKELYNLSGKSTSSIISAMVPDVLKGIGRISLHTNPFKIIKPGLQQLKNDPQTGFGTLFQMIS